MTDSWRRMWSWESCWFVTWSRYSLGGVTMTFPFQSLFSASYRAGDALMKSDWERFSKGALWNDPTLPKCLPSDMAIGMNEFIYWVEFLVHVPAHVSYSSERVHPNTCCMRLHWGVLRFCAGADKADTIQAPCHSAWFIYACTGAEGDVTPLESW